MIDDLAMMQRALNLARGTIALASPNPNVGCVLVRDDRILGEGAHFYDHRDHAEIAALNDAAARGISPVGATAYVTLEPCSHRGRTPPCADALIAAGIRRCVIATVDPNPLVSGQGIERLRSAGIAVEVGALQQPARELNDAFAGFIQTGRPFVTLKAAVSVDGKLAPHPARRTPGQPHWLTGPETRQFVQQLRHASDAILTGIGTVLADDPALTDRTIFPRRRPLLRIVLDTHLRVSADAQLVRTANNDVLIFCGEEAYDTPHAKALRNRIELIKVSSVSGRLSLPAILAVLAERRVVGVLLEGGSNLNGSFLTQDLVDKAILVSAQSELGDDALPFASGIPSPFLFEQSLRRASHTTLGADACTSGYLHDPWANL